MTKKLKSKLQNKEVLEVFNVYPKEAREKLLFLRKLIFDIASSTQGVGELEETLKWGEPSYLTSQSKSGSTIRLGWKRSRPEQYAIYFNCNTTLVDTFKEMYGKKFTYEGNRAIWFHIHDKIPIKELSHCISLALTYQLKKKHANFWHR